MNKINIIFESIKNEWVHECPSATDTLEINIVVELVPCHSNGFAGGSCFEINVSVKRYGHGRGKCERTIYSQGIRRRTGKGGIVSDTRPVHVITDGIDHIDGYGLIGSGERIYIKINIIYWSRNLKMIYCSPRSCYPVADVGPIAGSADPIIVNAL